MWYGEVKRHICILYSLSLIHIYDNGETDKTQEAKGFRFMGQRFTLDEAIFTNLTYSKVRENADGSLSLIHI